MKRIVLDTNSYSSLFRGDVKVKTKMDASTQVLVSIITLGELYAGFRKGSQNRKNLQILNRFLAKPKVKVVNIERSVAKEYGNIKFELAKKGTPIPENDIWIGACAIKSNAVVITYDKHFSKIPGLKIWDQTEN